jgi:hypothetical protein
LSAAATNWLTTFQNQLAALIQEYTSNFAWPVSEELNPEGWPIPAVPFATGISSILQQIPGMSPTLASALGWATFHTLMIFWPFGAQAVQLAVALAPALVVAAAGGAVGVAGAGAGAAVGIAVPLSVVPGVAAAAPVGGIAAPAPGGIPAGISPTPTVSSPAAPAPMTGIGGGPAGGGPGVGFGPTAADSLYAVGLSGLSRPTSAAARAQRKSPEPAPDDVEAAVAAAEAARTEERRRRQRGATATDRGHRYEFMDAEPAAIGATGLVTLPGDTFQGGPTVPMMPGSGATPETRRLRRATHNPSAVLCLGNSSNDSPRGSYR